MLFMEVEDLNQFYNDLLTLKLTDNYPTVRIASVKKHDWGNVCYLHDPSGILWHIGQFTK